MRKNFRPIAFLIIMLAGLVGSCSDPGGNAEFGPSGLDGDFGPSGLDGDFGPSGLDD